MSGKLTSQSTRSHGWAESSRRAVAPSRAITTRCPAPVSWACNRRVLSGASSTTRTVAIGRSLRAFAAVIGGWL